MIYFIFLSPCPKDGIAVILQKTIPMEREMFHRRIKVINLCDQTL